MNKFMWSAVLGFTLLAGAFTANAAYAEHGCRTDGHHGGHHGGYYGGGAYRQSYRPNYGGYGYGGGYYAPPQVYGYSRPAYPGYYHGHGPAYYGNQGSVGFSGPRGNSFYFRW